MAGMGRLWPLRVESGPKKAHANAHANEVNTRSPGPNAEDVAQPHPPCSESVAEREILVIGVGLPAAVNGPVTQRRTGHQRP